MSGIVSGFYWFKRVIPFHWILLSFVLPNTNAPCGVPGVLETKFEYGRLYNELEFFVILRNKCQHEGN